MFYGQTNIFLEVFMIIKGSIEENSLLVHPLLFAFRFNLYFIFFSLITQHAPSVLPPVKHR